MKITFLGHSGFMITCGEHNIVIDPFLTGNSLAKHTVKDIKASDILITHSHGDHLGDAEEIAKQNNIPVTAIFEISNYLNKRGVKTIGMNMGGKIKYKWGTAILTPALHSSSLPDGSYGGIAGSYILDIGGTIIFHAGDTGLHYNLKMIKEVYNPQIAMLPIGDHFTMGIDDAIKAAHWLGVEHVIPMHYNTFPPIEVNPDIFAQQIKDKLHIACTVLAPGESIEMKSLCKI